MSKIRAGLFVVLACGAVACSSSSDTSTSTTTNRSTTTSGGATSDTDRADAYAKQKIGNGEETGCSTIAPGAESEANSGCIYSVTFVGCLEGITGKQVGPM